MDDPEREKWFGANAVHNWNATVPVGTTIRYHSIACEGVYIETATRSEAWLLGSGEPVVLIKGRTGGVSIYHCRVVVAEAERRDDVDLQELAQDMHENIAERFGDPDQGRRG